MERDKCILLLDSSTDYCSVALVSEEGKLIGSLEEEDRRRQSERLALMANDLLQGHTLSAICVAEGPGSYTGLRIAAGYAKGLAWSLGIPLYSISTTQLICRSFLASHQESLGDSALLMPMIDARRMEVYTALYSEEAHPESHIEALILTDESTQKELVERVGSQPLYYFGSGAAKAEELFSQWLPQSRLVADIYPHAKDMAPDALRLLREGQPLDVAYWEPFYLKEYEAKKTKNKVLARL